MKILPALLCLALPAAPAQAPRKPFQAQASSSINYTVHDGEETADITTVSYDITGDSIPGRPPAERLVLRKTAHMKQVIGDKGLLEAKVTVAAWPLGADLKQKPLYSVDREAVDVSTRGNALLVFARGLEEVEWWSVHKLGDGQPLFDTYVPLLEFSTTRQIYTPRYVGFEAPPDNGPDKRLNDAHVIGVLTYASEERVIREALITCENADRARLLRSYWDQTRAVTLVEGTIPSIRITFRSNDPGKAPVTTELIVPVTKDDLDAAHAKLPPGLHIASWRR
jgi:hypothetical protein